MGRIEVNAFGSVRVRVNGKDVGFPPRCTGVLVRLMLARGRWVSVDELFRSVWSSTSRVGRDERIAVQKAITVLRRGLDPDRTGPSSEVLVTDRGAVSSYRLALDAASVDLYQFEDLLAAAASANHSLASEGWERALALWTDRPLRGVVDRPFVREAVAYLMDLRIRACADLVRAYARLGRLGEGLTILDQLVTIQQEDSELRAVVDRLRREQVVETPDAAIAIRPPPPADKVPAELPPQVYGFTGRGRELAALDDMLGMDDASPAMVISVLAGTGGVGKTALAMQWAHHVADRFPDGQLYVDLRGFDADEPLRPEDVLARFMVTLGARGGEMPYDITARAARYRSLLAGRRMLIVLDNAANSEQVRPLLPGVATCFVLVTTRDSLSGLVTRDGALRLDLDVLPLAEATELLLGLLGDRATAQSQTVIELAERCGRLPLALRIAAERAASRPDLSLTDLVAELADEHRRLDALRADERMAVRTVFSWSLRQLDGAVVRLFRLLGLHPGVDIDTYAAAALTDTPVEDIPQMIEALRRAYLVRSSSPHRIDMHDLVRAYAADLAVSADDEVDRNIALSRLFDFYLHGAGAAIDVVLPATASTRPATLVTRHAIPSMSERADGLAWLRIEMPNLIALSGYAAQHGWPSFATRLSATIWLFLLWNNDNLQLAQTVHENALHAARAIRDRGAEADAIVNLGRVCATWDSADEALDYFEHALAMLRENGDRHKAAAVVSGIGALYFDWGRYEEAADHFRDALAVMREFENPFGVAINISNLASVEDRLGRYESALAGYRRVVDLRLDIGDFGLAAVAMMDGAALLSRLGHHDKALEDAQRACAMSREAQSWHEGHGLNLVGLILCRLGRPDEALAYHQEALELYRRGGMAFGEAEALNGLGLVDLAHGRRAEAIAHHQRALELYRHIGAKAEQAETLNHLGVALHAAGDAAEAVRHHRQGAALARALGDRYEQARALHGAAVSLHAQAQTVEARRHLAEARALYAELGLPDAERIDLTG